MLVFRHKHCEEMQFLAAIEAAIVSKYAPTSIHPLDKNRRAPGYGIRFAERKLFYHIRQQTSGEKVCSRYLADKRRQPVLLLVASGDQWICKSDIP